ncbi:hypothetical protein JCM10207_006037 [Rhodosporidiobolus poonsookiae]
MSNDTSSEIPPLLSNILDSMPDDVNPWTYIRSVLRAEVRPHLGDSFLAQLYLNNALTAIGTVVLIACMFVKWRSGTYWICRRYRGTGGSYLVSAFSTFMIIFLGILQGYIYQTREYVIGAAVPTTALWRTLVWFPGVLAFYAATWSLVVSHILHKDSSGRPARTFFASAIFVNSVGVLVPIGAAIALALLARQAHLAYDIAMERYEYVDYGLSVVEASYNGTFDITQYLDTPYLSTAEQFTTSLDRFGSYFRWCFVTYLAWCLLLEGILGFSATLHLRELRKTMEALQNRSQHNDEQEATLEQSYRGLVWVTWGILASLTSINVLFAFVTGAGRKIVYDQTYSQVASLLPIYIFSVFSVTLGPLFLYRLIRTSRPVAPRRAHGKTDSMDANNAIAVPIHNVDGFDTPSSAKGTPTEDYPMTTLGSVAYGSPHGMNHAYDDRRMSPSSFQSGSEAHLVHQSPIVTTATQPFYSSYETRQPSPSLDAVSAAARKKGRKQ